MSKPTLARARRRSELSLGLLAVVITVGGYILVALSNGPRLPPDLYVLLAWIVGLYLVAHLAVRRFAPYADATLLPLAALLNGIGFVMITRLAQADPKDYRAQARVQSLWVAIGVGVFVLTLILVRDVRIFERYRYTALLLGIAFLMLPVLPGIGRTINGARLWVGVGGLTFEPSEIAKVLLVAFFAAYLVDKRELLAHGRVRVGRWFLPSLRDLGPLLLAWGAALVVLGYQKDVGTSLLFFGAFAAMLYMATRRFAYVVGSLVLLVIGAYVAYKAFGHVRVRVQNWNDPWKDPTRSGYQIIQGWLAIGIRRGRGDRTRARSTRPHSRPQPPTSSSPPSVKNSGSRERSGSSPRSCCSSAARTASRSTRPDRSRNCSRPVSRRSSGCKRSSSSAGSLASSRSRESRCRSSRTAVRRCWRTSR